MKPLVVALVTILSFVGALPATADDADVKAARLATSRHNDSVKNERKKLEAAIERAKHQYQQQVIRTKERYVAQLDDSLKLAMKNANLDNANAINRQIDKVNRQIASLKGRGVDEGAGDKPQEKLAPGLKREYVGQWHIQYPTGFWRKIAVFPDGTVYVIANKGNGIDVGAKYKLQVKDGGVIIHSKNWANELGGKVDAIKLDKRGQVRHLHYRTAQEFHDGKSAEFDFKYAYKENHRELNDEVKKLAGYKKDEQPHQPVDEKPSDQDGVKEKLDFDDNDPVDEPGVEDDEGLFGLPLE